MSREKEHYLRDTIVSYFIARKDVTEQEFSEVEADLDKEIGTARDMVLDHQVSVKIATRQKEHALRRNNLEEAKIEHETKEHHSALVMKATCKTSGLLLIQRALKEMRLQQPNLNQINIKQLMDRATSYEIAARESEKFSSMNPQASFDFLVAVQDYEGGYWSVSFALTALTQNIQPKFTMDDRTLIQLAKAQERSEEEIATILMLHVLKKFTSDNKGEKWLNRVAKGKQFLERKATTAEKIKAIEQALQVFGLSLAED